jgi:hypothetical protein
MSTKAEWYKAYRIMRVVLKSNPQNHSALCSLDKMLFRAYCVLEYHRGRPQIWDTPIVDRMEQGKIVDEILNEILGER